MSSNEAKIRAWARGETFPWRRRRVFYDDALHEYARLNETLHVAFLYQFRDGDVSLIDKPEVLRVPQLQDRANEYLKFFKAVVNETPFAEAIVIAVGVGDGPLDSKIAPTFSFQKPAGHPTILLNDINMIEGDFYEPKPFLDTTDFSCKKHRAIFVGSTSGMHNSGESVRARSNQRINAALYFKDHESVEFYLPNIVQCDAEAEALIRAMDLGAEYIGWQRQFEYKFLLSLDGNGAACQRIAVALKSNCAVLKYESDSLLYYFKGLVPWYHYIPISDNAEVVDVIEGAAKDDDLLREIAENGRQFYQKFLTRRAQSLYFWYLLTEYSSVFSQGRR